MSCTREDLIDKFWSKRASALSGSWQNNITWAIIYGELKIQCLHGLGWVDVGGCKTMICMRSWAVPQIFALVRCWRVLLVTWMRTQGL